MSNKAPRIVLVRRDDLPTLTSVVVDGQTHELGIHKDLRRHPALAAILPEAARLSIAWVHLRTGQTLDVHQHPVATMIVMCAGRGRLTGDREESLEAGDVVAIPGGCRHGFVGGEGGYWALSMQFDGLGLYENPEAARVAFTQPRSAGLAELLRRNREFEAAFTSNPMFDLVRDGHLADPARRARYLDVVQVWSNAFHRLLLLRSATMEDTRFSGAFDEHLSEEFDHAARLAKDRGPAAPDVWDPALDAASSWFVLKMLGLDPAEKVVLVHMVLEVGSRAFHEVANPVLSPYGETDYFAIHEEADEAHEQMCIEEIDGLDARTYERLFRVQKQGWDMLQALCARMASLVAP